MTAITRKALPHTLAPMQGAAAITRRRVAEYVKGNDVVPFATEFRARLGSHGDPVHYTDLHRGGVRPGDLFPGVMR